MFPKILKRYLFFICTLIVVILISLFYRNIGLKTFSLTGSSFYQMLSVLPPIMLLLGLMDEWVPREKLLKFMGENSGMLGIFFAFLIGSIAAGPMYAAFPFTTVLLRKGVKFSNIIIFMNAWCVTKISTFMFELTALGTTFTLTRLAVNIPGIIFMGLLTQRMLSENELEKVYKSSEKLNI